MDDAFALLRLQLEWGVDEALDPDPIDRMHPVEARLTAEDPGSFVTGLGSSGSSVIGLGTPHAASGAFNPAFTARGSGFEPSSSADARAASSVSGTSIQPPRPAADQPKGTPAERAVALAGRAATPDELRDALANFDGCALRDTASNLVFAEGNRDSDILLIGGPPGRDEDRGGHPFAGPEGELLDQMLLSIGLTRGELMLTPLLPWRPPGGRPASATEIAICLPFLHRLIALLHPSYVVLFGAIACRALLPSTPSRRRAPRGWVELSIPGLPATPNALLLPGLPDMLKSPPLRRDAWAGLRLLRRTLDGKSTKT